MTASTLTEPRPGGRHRALALARGLFTPLALGCLALAAYSARDVFGQVLAQARPLPLALVVIGWSALHLLSPLLAFVTLRGQGIDIRYASSLSIHVRRLPARYLPGGIWHTVSRVVDLHRLGVDKPRLTVLVLVENLVPLAVAAGVGAAFAMESKGFGHFLSGLLMASLLLLVALPWLLARVAPSTRLSGRNYLAAVAVAVAFWLAAASLFALYWSAFPDLQVDGRISGLFAAYLLSWSAGFVVVFAPQGLGVFEAVASLLLNGSLPFAGMAVLMAGFRALTLAGDGLAYLVGSLPRWTAGRMRENMR